MAVTAPGANNVPTPRGGSEAYQFMRADIFRLLPDYEVINDCIAGERIIKEKGAVYLPPPEFFPATCAPDHPGYIRYQTYRQRAVFYNVAERTLSGLTGEVFLRDPEVKVPVQLEAVIKDANGDGVSLDQQAKIALDAVLSKGRGGLFVDYPPTNGPTTVAQQRSGEIRPTIQFYQPENVINWKRIKRGGKWLLSLVVLKEEYDYDEGDGFITKVLFRYRVLKLVNDVYVQELYTPDKGAEPEVFKITDGKGRSLPEIPFQFLGAKSNSPTINAAPMLSLCSLNIAHYRNSADYEEAVFQLGQPTAVATGLTQQWVDNVLKGEVRVGSRGGIPLPTGATFQIAQVQPNTLAKEAMDAKEEQMVSLGAKLVQEREVTQTATEAEINSSAETSVLQSCAGNVGKGFKWALEWCGIFANVIDYADDATARDKQVTYKINSDFDIMRLTWQDRQQLLKEWQAHAITTSEYRAALTRAGVASLPDDEYELAAQEEQAADMEQQAELIQMQAQASATLKSEDPTSSGGKARA